MKMKKLPCLLNIILGLALALTPFYLFPVCAEPRPDGGPMLCWYSGVLIAGLGAVVVMLSLLGLWRRLSALSFVASSFAALLCWLVPKGIVRVDVLPPAWPVPCRFGLCADPSHACRAVTMPAVGSLVAAVLAVSAVGLILNFVAGKR